MDTSLLIQEISLLKAAYLISLNKTEYKSLNPGELSILSQAYQIYQSHYYQDGDFIDLGNSFGEVVWIGFFASDLRNKETLNKLIENLKKETNSTEEVSQEESSVPATLEAMVAAYEKNQVERANLENIDTHPIAEAIKRARSTQVILQRAKIRAEVLKQNNEDKFFTNNIDPKTNNRTQSEKNIRQTATILVTSTLAEQGVKQNSSTNQRIIEEIVEQIESGSIKGYDEIRYVSEIFIKDEYPTFKAEYEEVDNLIKEEIYLETTEPGSEELEELNQEITQVSKKIVIDSNKFKEQKANLYSNDLDKFTKNAYSDAEYFQERLKKVIPNPQLPFSQVDAVAILSNKINNYLQKNYNYIDSQGARTVGIIKKIEEKGGKVQGQNSSVVELYSRGITSEKLEELAKKDNYLNEILKKQLETTKLVHTQLRKIEKTKFGKEILNRYEKYNKFLESPLGKATSFISTPTQVAKNYVYKQIGKSVGEYLVKQTSSEAAKKVGGYILKDGLKVGVETFTKEAATKLAAKAATWAATKIGISLTAESLNAIVPGLGLVVDAAIQIGLWVVEKTYIAARDKWREFINYDEEKARENKKALLIGLAAAGITATGLLGFGKRGVRGFVFATKAAVISAAGIIWLSLATIAVFLTLTFMVAPLLSTFVQFDAEEKVQYEANGIPVSTNSDCGWPIAPGYQVVEGPRGGTHSKSQLEAIDIWGSDIDGKSIISSTDGIVVSAGTYSNYGNTVQIQSKNSTGTFKVLYGHMSSMGVKVGQQIKKGQKIGLVGGTGGWSPHIHLEYQGIKYNQCPAGGVTIKDLCVGFAACGKIMTGEGPKVI